MPKLSRISRLIILAVGFDYLTTAIGWLIGFAEGNPLMNIFGVLSPFVKLIGTVLVIYLVEFGIRKYGVKKSWVFWPCPIVAALPPLWNLANICYFLLFW